ncbi:MAG: hypothetical protein ABDH19_00735 [Thermodesulfovibrio sp.]
MFYGVFFIAFCGKRKEAVEVVVAVMVKEQKEDIQNLLSFVYAKSFVE